jgi:hypothetical protein
MTIKSNTFLRRRGRRMILLTCGTGMRVLAQTRSIASDSERANAKESHSFTTVSSDIWTTASHPARLGEDAARRMISWLSHASDVDFQKRQEVRVMA